MGELRSVTRLLFVNCAILVCVLLKGLSATYIENEIATRGLNCTAVLIEKPMQRNDAPAAEMAQSNDVDYTKATSIYDFTVKESYGRDVPLEMYRGKLVLIVNFAARCHLAKENYPKLTQISKYYYDKGLRILGFPSNEFGQMPESDGDEIVCHLDNEKADFGDIFAKVKVNDDAAHPLYKYLTSKKSGPEGASLKWNFTKFLIDKNGQVVMRYEPDTDLMDIAKDIEKML